MVLAASRARLCRNTRAFTPSHFRRSDWFGVHCRRRRLALAYAMTTRWPIGVYRSATTLGSYVKGLSMLARHVRAFLMVTVYIHGPVRMPGIAYIQGPVRMAGIAYIQGPVRMLSIPYIHGPVRTAGVVYIHGPRMAGLVYLDGRLPAVHELVKAIPE